MAAIPAERRIAQVPGLGWSREGFAPILGVRRLAHLGITRARELLPHKEIKLMSLVTVEEMERRGGVVSQDKPNQLIFPHIPQLAMEFDPSTSNLTSLAITVNGRVDSRPATHVATILENNRATVVLPPFDKYGAPASQLEITISKKEPPHVVIFNGKSQRDISSAVELARRSLPDASTWLG